MYKYFDFTQFLLTFIILFIAFLAIIGLLALLITGLLALEEKLYLYLLKRKFKKHE